MAYGTLKFDTLTTSDSVNTSTDKSLNTSYIFNGVPKVWINFNGEGTIAARDSFNIGSLTDVGTARYRANLTNNMGNDDYCVAGSVGEVSGTDISGCWFSTGFNQDSFGSTITTSQFSVQVYYSTSQTADTDSINAAVNGDLA